MVSNRARFSWVARSALPLGRRKLRAYPSLTRTVSPIWPSLATRSNRITSIDLSIVSDRLKTFASRVCGRRQTAPPRDAAADVERGVGKPDQRRDEQRPLERRDRRIDPGQHEAAAAHSLGGRMEN